MLDSRICICLDWSHKLENLERILIDALRTASCWLNLQLSHFEWQPLQLSTRSTIPPHAVHHSSPHQTNPISTVFGKQSWAWCNEDLHFLPMFRPLCAFLWHQSKTQRSSKQRCTWTQWPALLSRRSNIFRLTVAQIEDCSHQLAHRHTCDFYQGCL